MGNQHKNISLYDYVKVNEMDYLLIEYSEKNIKKTTEFSYGSKRVCIWNCQTCQSEYSARVGHRTYMKSGCPYCDGKKVNHTNSLWSTNPQVAELLKDKNRGHEITKGGHNYESFICPSCNNLEKKRVPDVVNYGLSCGKCGDGTKYPEKFMFNVLEQSSIKFIKGKTFRWSKGKIYDFYLPSLNCIIETHGKQHYEFTGFKRSLDDERRNDREKRRLASENGIKYYIEIDCRLSDLDHIKTNIIMSKLKNILHLQDIDWLKCHEFALGSMVKRVFDLYKSKKFNIKELSTITNFSENSVRKWLNQGAMIGWCEYIPIHISITNQKSIIQLDKNNVLINTHDSISDAYQFTNISRTAISNVINGRSKSAGGFKWMYKENYEKYIEEQNKQQIS